MKFFNLAFVLLAFVRLSLIGCSDKTRSLVDPIDQASLQKALLTNFTFIHYPIAEPTGGTITLTPGGKWQEKKIEVLEKFVSSNPLVDGIMKHYLSNTIDAVTGEGPSHGSWVLTPNDLTASGGGVWEGTYEGYISKSNVPGEWTLPLKVEGHGRGGTIDGMQVFATSTLTLRADGTTALTTSWIGTGEGFYKSH